MHYIYYIKVRNENKEWFSNPVYISRNKNVNGRELIKFIK